MAILEQNGFETSIEENESLANISYDWKIASKKLEDKLPQEELSADLAIQDFSM